MCLRVIYKKKSEIFFASLNSLKKGVGSGSISKKYGSEDPDPHQNVTDPQRPTLVRGADPRIRIGTKMTRIPNTGKN
jgi:hypothetical protein